MSAYLWREVALPFAVGLGLFFVLIAFGQLVEISDSVTGLGVSGTSVFRALVYSLPPLLGLLLPIATLFSVLLAFGRLAVDRELLALQAAGFSPYRLLWTPLWFGTLTGLGSLVALVFGEPWGLRELRALMSGSARETLARGVQPGEFTQWLPGLSIYAEGSDQGLLRGLFLADLRDPEGSFAMAATTGRVVAAKDSQDIIIEAFDGSILTDKPSNEKWLGQHIKFGTLRYRITIEGLVQNKLRTVTEAQYLSIEDLFARAKDPALPPERRALFLVTAHRKLALPVASVLFALLAVPLAMGRSTAARARGVLLSAGIVAGYYYIGRAFELSARAGTFPAEWASWVPNLIGLLALVMLLFTLPRRTV